MLSFVLVKPRPPTSTLFPYTTLFRSRHRGRGPLPIWTPPSCLAFLHTAALEIPSCDASVAASTSWPGRSEEHTSELQSLTNLVCRLLLEKKKKAKDK